MPNLIRPTRTPRAERPVPGQNPTERRAQRALRSVRARWGFGFELLGRNLQRALLAEEVFFDLRMSDAGVIDIERAEATLCATLLLAGID